MVFCLVWFCLKKIVPASSCLQPSQPPAGQREVPGSDARGGLPGELAHPFPHPPTPTLMAAPVLQAPGPSTKLAVHTQGAVAAFWAADDTVHVVRVPIGSIQGYR